MIVLFLYSEMAVESEKSAEARGGERDRHRPHHRTTAREDHGASVKTFSPQLSPNEDGDESSPLRATIFHAVGLKAIDANERYKEGLEKSMCRNKLVMVGEEEEEKGMVTWRQEIFSFLAV